MKKGLILLSCCLFSTAFADFFCNDVVIHTQRSKAAPIAFGHQAHCCLYKGKANSDPAWKKPLWVYDSCQFTQQPSVEATGCGTDYCNFSVWYQGCLDPHWCNYFKSNKEKKGSRKKQ